MAVDLIGPAGKRRMEGGGHEEFKSSPVLDIATKSLISVHPETSVCEACSLMVDKGIRRVPVVDSDGCLEGILSARDLVGFFGKEPGYEKPMTSVGGELCSAAMVPISEIMTRDVLSFEEEETIGNVAKNMLKSDIGGCPIIDGNGLVIALVTEGDFTKAVADWEYDFRVKDIMSHDVDVLKSGQSISDAIHLMTSGHRRLPVMKGDTVIGIVRAKHILKEFTRCCSDRSKETFIGDMVSGSVDGMMGRHFVSLRLRDKIEEIIDILRALRKGGFPVEDDGKLVGMVTENDIFRMAYSE